MQAIAREGPRERARERAMADLSDAELLALVLGTGNPHEGVAVVAARLLDEMGGLSSVATAGYLALARQSGVGEVKGMRIAAGIELGRRAHSRAWAGQKWVPNSRAVAEWAAEIAASEHEELWVLVVDGQNRLRAARRVASGGIHGLSVSVRDPLRIALREAACGMILVHNHPSGDATPSPQDIDFTRRIARAAATVGLPLLDHVVVARGGGMVSMLDRGLLRP